ncbi:phage neck terminator protein [Dryocola sp. BD613]|uniref:phage neck terminator protein n=1 Tax=Dryocola sp. BD613 TaxID=3133272 RepID=UPI003F4F504E
MNDSTRPGYLVPVSSPPNYDEQLESQLGNWIAGVSGLPAEMVLARWTEQPPATPAAGLTWCEFDTCVQLGESPAFVSVDGHKDALRQTEVIAVNCSFYGPGAQAVAALFRDGLYVAQNNAGLNRIGPTFVTCGALVPAPELISNQWQRRYNLTVTLHRQVVREYGIQSLVSASVNIFGE